MSRKARNKVTGCLLLQIVDDDTYSYWWSCCVLAAEIGGFILVHISQQMFVRQDTKFYPLPPEHVQKLRDVRCRSSSYLC